MQSVHVADLVVFANVPSAQTVHEAEPLEDEVPVGQSSHAVNAPFDFVPASQGVHEADATDAAIVPAAQSEQYSEPSAAVSPAGQSIAAVIPSLGHTLPAGQIVQNSFPVPSLYSFTGHGTGITAVVGFGHSVPAGHATHDVKVWSSNVH